MALDSATFGVPVGHLGVLLVAAMLGYLASSFCAGWLVARLGVGPVLAWSSLLMVANSFVSWLHASYGVGAMLGPLLMTATLTSGVGWHWGYGLLGLALAAMAAVFALTLDL